MSSLSRKKCAPCAGGIKPMPQAEAESLLAQLHGWKLSDDAHSIGREYLMKNFMAAVDLIQGIARIAESENHHPDIRLTDYRRLFIELSTHEIGGLSENDFILAAKIEKLPKKLK